MSAPPRSSREERLKAALRDNLHRRKAQRRGRSDRDEALAEAQSPGLDAENPRPEAQTRTEDEAD